MLAVPRSENSNSSLFSLNDLYFYVALKIMRASKHSDRLDVFLDHQRHSEMTFLKPFAKMT